MEDLPNLNMEECWNKIVHAFPTLNEYNKQAQDCTEEELNNAIILIRSLNLSEQIIGLVFNNVKREMRCKIVPKFWAKFVVSSDSKQGFDLFMNAVNELYDDILKFVPIMNDLGKLQEFQQINRKEQFKLIVHGTLLSQLPTNYDVIIHNFYEISLKVFCFSDSQSEERAECKRCDYDKDNCQCQNIIDTFHSINRKLIEMDLLECLVIQEVTSLIRERIVNHVKETFKSNYDVSYLEVLENWLKTVVLSWITQIITANSTTEADVTDIISVFQHKLMYMLYETYMKTVIDKLFSIIIEYPESIPVIDDIRVCLPKTNLKSELTSKLQRTLQTRLLHQGVSTNDILTAYVSAIRALRRLDSSGVLLDMVTEPVRKYLRNREDTVRCVVLSLTEEGSSELADELVKGDALHLDDGSGSDEETDDWLLWKPDPVDADPRKTSKTRRTSDIISMLVNVFGSKELFVNEYRTLLADRLLSQPFCSTEKEIRYLELLKLRFGDSQLHYCDVMLKDIAESKRINSHLQNDSNYAAAEKPFPTTAMILSAQFWPPFKEETHELFPEVKEQLELYTRGFETLKGNRTLNWKNHLGSVDLEIELKERIINVTVSPMLATIIMHFQNKEKWTIDELSQTMKVPTSVLRRKIAFWQMHGLIREESYNSFILVEDSPPKMKGVPISDMICEVSEEGESAMASTHDQRKEELQIFWSYVIGMLTNLESLPLDRMYQMLKVFAPDGSTSTECSIQELREFLNGKVREHKLILSGGLYKLPK